MDFQEVPNGVRVVLEATQNTVPNVNVYHVKCAGAPTDANLTDIAEVFRDWWVANIQPNLHVSYILNTITATDISVEDGHQVQIVLTTGNAGGVSTAPLAANAAVVLSWRTANIGRSFRGRTYIGGLPEVALSDAQHIGSAAATAYTAFGTSLIDALETAGFILSVLSRVANGVVRVAGLLTQIIGIVVDTKIDSQRRRTAN